MPKPSSRMHRDEFQELAGLKKTRYFDILADPSLAKQLDAGHDEDGRTTVNRRKAVAFIRELLAKRNAARLKVGKNLGDWSHMIRKRPCPKCRRFITLKRTICRHCGAAVDASTEAPQLAGRPCQACQKRVSKNAKVCRHCQADV